MREDSYEQEFYKYRQKTKETIKYKIGNILLLGDQSEGRKRE